MINNTHFRSLFSPGTMSRKVLGRGHRPCPPMMSMSGARRRMPISRSLCRSNPSNSIALQGAYLKSVELMLE
jgi:hypothetical protein